MSFEGFAEVYSSIVSLLDTANGVTNCDVSGPGCFIDNYGSATDRAEAFLLLLPIAERILKRPDTDDEKVGAAERAAVKGKKE